MQYLIKKFASLPLLRNTSWMLLSEMIAKVSRLLTIITLAAFLSPEQYGVAALALLWHEAFRVFSRAGAGAKVIQCAQPELEATASAAWLQQCLVCVAIVALQFSLAPLLADYYQQAILSDLLRLSAVSHLFYLAVSRRVFLLQRAGRMQAFGLAQAFSVTTDNLGICLFLIAGFGLQAIAYAKILAALAWLIIFMNIPVASLKFVFDVAIFNRLWGFSFKVFSSELLKLIRFQLDILLAASLLTPEMLGIYSFAKNAGVGLSQSLSNAYIVSLLPYLADRFREHALSDGVTMALKCASGLALIFVAQALVAPLYISWFFADHWQESAFIVSLLCIVAIPGLFLDVFGLLYRVQHMLVKEILLLLIPVLCSAAIIFLAQPNTAAKLAELLLFSTMIWVAMAAVSLMSYQTIFNSTDNIKKVNS